MTDPMTRPQPAREAAIDPALPICDPHHHLWDRDGSRYVLDELLSDLGQGHHVISTVFVECMSEYRASGPEALRPVGETDFVERIARDAEHRGAGTPRVAAGIISYADLTLGAAVDQVLEAHLAASPRFRGIRHASGWDASPDIRNSHTNPPEHLLLDAKFREGFARLAHHGLVFDSWQYHPAARRPRRPRARISRPRRSSSTTSAVRSGSGRTRDRHAEVFRDWKRGVEAVAACPNVVVKLGGIAMPINGFGWHKPSRRRPPSSSPPRSGRITRPASSSSDRSAACSRATSRSIG